MATVSGASLDSDSAAVAERRIKPQWAVLAVGLALCALYLALPERFVFLREELLYVGVEFGAALAVVAGIRLFRPTPRLPWYLIAVGWALWALGDLLWGVYTLLDEDPFPSAADAFYLAGYPVIATGVALAARRRFAERDRGAVLDVVVLTTSAALLMWVYLVEPLRADADPGLLTGLVTIAYPVGDLLLLSVVAGFLVRGAWGVSAFRWLTASFAITLLADLLYLLAQLGYMDLADRYINTMFLVGAVCLATAALSPSMRLLTERSFSPAGLPGLVRLVLVALAALLPFAVLAVQVARDESTYLALTLVSAAVLFSAALLRWGSLLTDQRQTTKREARLRAYAARLLEASGEQELKDVAERTAQTLVAGGSARIVPVAGLAEPGPRRFVGQVVVRGELEAELLVDGSASEISRLSETLTTITNQLALALEREHLLESERNAAAALSDQNERLRELDRMKDQFVSTVSHELRTPLTAMMGYLELTLDGEAGGLTEEQHRFLGIVSRNCTRLNRLIDDILFISRVEAGRMTLSPDWVALDQVAWTAVESAQATADWKDVDVQFSADGELPQLWADPTRLAQMVDNLLTNASKFTPDGGAVTVRVGQSDGALHLEVADTGVGIPDAEVGRLFERFFRASTGAAIQGTGLGLPIVKSIVEVHRGTIAVESELGVGTTFAVDLPLPGLPDAPTVHEHTEVAT